MRVYDISNFVHYLSFSSLDYYDGSKPETITRNKLPHNLKPANIDIADYNLIFKYVIFFF